MNLLSRSEELALLAVWHLQHEAYGASIRSYLTRSTETEWSIASVYTPLDRLARKGFVGSHVGAPTPERGGRSKKMYRLTPMGVRALRQVRSIHDRLWNELPDLAWN